LSVLPQEVLDALVPVPGGVYIDGTVGGGGHAQALLAAAQPGGKLLGLDADPAALAAAQARLTAAGLPHTSFTLHHGHFDAMAAIAQTYGFTKVDGILLDLGVSSHQLAASALAPMARLICGSTRPTAPPPPICSTILMRSPWPM
jgi:16S rRNA (cytosine1402-N4)-methyltransferase